jgi:dihydrolipoamide dehydrogenase
MDTTGNPAGPDRVEPPLSLARMERYDLAIIGGGPAGHAAAMRAIDLGMRVVLVERDRIGGTGIYNGALASKTLWEMAMRVSGTNELMRKRGREPLRLEWDEVNRTLQEAMFERKYLHACHMQLLAEQRNERGEALFTYERGSARLAGPHAVSIERAGRSRMVEAANVIIATGSRPRVTSGLPMDGVNVLTSDHVFDLEAPPESIVIVGAGVIGCEFATIFSNLGRTRVHIIDRAERILPFEDEDVSELVSREMERHGVIIHRNAKLERLTIQHDGPPDGRVAYELSYPDGRYETVRVSKALLSIGRVANTDRIGLELAGVHLDDRGQPILRGTATSVEHIHVVGDATGGNMLVNLGELEGRHAVEVLAGMRRDEPDHVNMSTIMFLDPEVAGVGPNEQECRARGIPYRMARIDYSCLARAIAMRRTRGFFKLLVTNDDDMRVIGMRAVGEHASSAIQAVALMIRKGMPVRELAELLHPHPSITEGVQECARMLIGTSIFKPEVLGDKLQCTRWAPAVQAA